MNEPTEPSWRDTELPPGSASQGTPWWLAVSKVIEDINGFVYQGDSAETILDVIKYFRANPDAVKRIIFQSPRCDPLMGYHATPHKGCILR